MIPEHEKKITADKAILILKEKKVELSPEHVALVVGFMYVLAALFYQKHKEL